MLSRCQNLQGNEQLVRSIDLQIRDAPKNPLAVKGHYGVWNSCRGNHLGQRSRASARKGRTYGSKRSDQKTANDLVTKGPSTYGFWSRNRRASIRTPGDAAPFCPRGRDVGARCRAVEELDQVCRLAASASSCKNASNTPERLSRQNRFHTLFHLPNSPGSARQVMLCTVKYGRLPGIYGRHAPALPGSIARHQILPARSTSRAPSFLSACPAPLCRSRSDSNKTRFGNPSETHVRDSVHTA